MAEPIRVTSNVGRDLLASAAQFKTDYAVVWEYVSNSLQYVDVGTVPRIQVYIRPRAKRIEIIDNGKGMTEQGLKQFFQMHGENEDRRKGVPGRGRWGTGKSAAFGIATVLRVDSVRNGTRNVVQLDRETIDSSAGEEIEVRWLIKNEDADSPNGTTVTIDGILLPKLSAAPVIDYIERHLQAYRGSKPEIAINDHYCEYKEPVVASTQIFRPSESQARILGNIKLVVKVAQGPLPKMEQGITVTAGTGNLLAIETLGVETKELGNYLFGNVDVPALESSDSPIQPIDPSRSLQLNKQHPVALELLPFIGTSLETVRKQRARELKDKQRSEEARRLNQVAERIATILNADFLGLMDRLHGIRSAAARPGRVGSLHGTGLSAGTQEDVWVEGTALPGSLLDEGDYKAPEIGGGEGRPDPDIRHEGVPDVAGVRAVDPAGGSGSSRRRPRGGFRVDFNNLGEDSGRSSYDRVQLSIIINKDHPAIRNALQSGGGSVESPEFRRLAHEVAFAEYAVAVGSETADRDPEIPPEDLIFEIHRTLDRVTATAASVYR